MAQIIKTFKQLQDDALGWFDEVEDQDTIRENVKQAIKAAHTARCNEHPWHFMKYPAPVRFSTELGKKHYALHQQFQRPIYFYNVTAKRWMRQVDDGTLVQSTNEGDFLGWLDGAGSDWTDTTASAIAFELRGLWPVQKQPSGIDEVLQVGSFSGSDGVNQSVRIVGETVDGVAEETIVCGTSGTLNFYNILKVTKLGTWSGRMVLFNVTDGQLLTLFPDEIARQYQVLTLLSDPAQVETIEYLFYRQPNNLENDNDIPDLPAGFHDLLTYDALIDLATYTPVESAALKIWTARQQMLERGLENANGEATALEREAQYVKYIP
jgi:hypothetical protein